MSTPKAQTFEDLFIVTPANHPAHNAELSERYAAVLSALTTMLELSAAYKNATGKRVPTHCHGEKRTLYLQRERACAVAYYRLQVAQQTLFSLLQPLMDTANESRAANVDMISKGWYESHILQNNLIAAEELYDEGCKVCFEFRLIYCGSIGYDGITELFTKQRPSLERRFVTKSSGHGSAYRFNGADPFTPPPGPYMTKTEAETDASNWEGIADTIGGSAIVVDLREYAAHLARMEALRNTEPTAEQAGIIASCLTRARRDIAEIYKKKLDDDGQRCAYRGSIRVCRSDSDWINDKLVILHVAKKLQEEGIAVIDFTVHGSYENELCVPHKDESAAQ